MVPFLPAELIHCSLDMEMGWASVQGVVTPRPGGREKGCEIQEGKHCRQTPESSSEFAARDSREGERNRQRLLGLDS